MLAVFSTDEYLTVIEDTFGIAMEHQYPVSVGLVAVPNDATALPALKRSFERHFVNKHGDEGVRRP